MAAFDKITEGQVLHDYHREKMGHTTMTREGHWTVTVVSVDPETRTAQCSWNGNRPRTYTERMLGRLRVNPKKPRA